MLNAKEWASVYDAHRIVSAGKAQRLDLDLTHKVIVYKVGHLDDLIGQVRIDIRVGNGTGMALGGPPRRETECPAWNGDISLVPDHYWGNNEQACHCGQVAVIGATARYDKDGMVEVTADGTG